MTERPGGPEELGADLPELDAAGAERVRALLRAAAPVGPMPPEVVARVEEALARARAELPAGSV
ncbi:hypothetical protein, partial [Kineococcus glutinatus]|uniref:hypothetical protein n=1 Tax=Kineococcus glutinatus TaxID=1070872 RepID=UPI0031EE9494